MIIRASKRDTGLSQSYRIETLQGPRGTVCIVYDQSNRRIGQFTNPRQQIGDKSPLTDVMIHDETAMAEVLKHWGPNYE